jgi:hypothetical protein
MLPGSEITFKFIFLQTNPLPDARERSHYTIKLTANSPFSSTNAVSFSSARTLSRSPKSNRASCASASVTAQDDSYTRVARYQVLP